MSDLAGRSVCIVGINFEPESTGIGPYTTAMATTLADAGARVSVVTGVPHYPQWSITDPTYRDGRRWSERFGDVIVTRRRHYVPERPDLVGRARMESSFFTGAARAVRADRSDVVIAVTPSIAGLAAAAVGASGRAIGAVVQDLTGNAAGESGTTGGRVSGILARSEYALLRRFDSVGVIAPRFGEILISKGIEPRAIRDVANFTHISPVQATTAEARSKLGWDTDAFIVLHTGNMGRKQGLESVVDAARIVEQLGLPIQFVLVGDGNQRSALQSSGRGLAHLKFVDPLSSADYPYALAAADLLLLNELPGVLEMSLPSKLTSYSVAGKPIVAAVEPGGITYETLGEEQYAAFARPGDAAGLVAAVESLRGDSARRADLARRALRLHDRKYSVDAARARYIEFAQTLTEARQRKV